MAAAKFEKHVSLLNVTRTTTSTSYTFTTDRNGFWYYDADVYDNVTAIYFEGVMRATAADDAYMVLSKVSDSSDVTGSEITTDSTTNIRVRSGDIKANLVDGTDYRLRFKSGAGATASFDAARVIIVQQGAVSKTETVIMLGERNSLGTSYFNMTTYPRFLFESGRFDGTVNIYLEATLKCGNAARTAYVKLYDTTATADVSSSEISHTGDTTATRVRSGALTLVDGHSYEVLGTSADASSEDALSVCLIIQQSGTVTKTDCYIPTLNTNTAGASTSYVYQDRFVDFSASNWSGDSVAYYYEARVAVQSGGTGYYNLYNDTDASQIGELEFTNTVLAGARSGALTMPSDDGNQLNTGRKAATLVTTTVHHANLIAQVNWSASSTTNPSWGWGVNGW